MKRIKRFIILIFCLLALPLYSNEQSSEAIKLSWNIKRKLAYAEVTASQLTLYEENEKRIKRLEKRFLKGQIIGLELIIAAPTGTSIESRWGHTLLRFVDNFGSGGNDYVLGFVADLNTAGIKYLKGLFVDMHFIQN